MKACLERRGARYWCRVVSQESWSVASHEPLYFDFVVSGEMLQLEPPHRQESIVAVEAAALAALFADQTAGLKPQYGRRRGSLPGFLSGLAVVDVVDVADRRLAHHYADRVPPACCGWHARCWTGETPCLRGGHPRAMQVPEDGPEAVAVLAVQEDLGGCTLMSRTGVSEQREAGPNVAPAVNGRPDTEPVAMYVRERTGMALRLLHRERQHILVE